MPKHYVYRMDHDTGFAPHVSGETCTLCGCKTTTVERWARPGSWIVGIGGNGTGRPNTLIYAMEVDATPTVAELRRETPELVAYLRGRSIGPNARVLVAKRFFYFGRNAIPLLSSPVLERLMIRAQGCRKLSDDDVAQLSVYLHERFRPGVHGVPNNLDYGLRSRRRCGCGRSRLPGAQPLQTFRPERRGS